MKTITLTNFIGGKITINKDDIRLVEPALGNAVVTLFNETKYNVVETAQTILELIAKDKK